MKALPLNQKDYTMKIVEDLGNIQIKPEGRKSRYAIVECTKCTEHFRLRVGSTAAKTQKLCETCNNTSTRNTKHPLYAVWNGIKQRCYSPKRKDYSKYGGIGVTMHKDWLNDPVAFITFCEANGWKQGLVVDKDIKCREQNIVPTIYAPYTLSFITTKENAAEANAKAIMQYDLNDTLIAEYSSCVEAVEALGKPATHKSGPAKAARGVAKTYLGFKWKWKY